MLYSLNIVFFIFNVFSLQKYETLKLLIKLKVTCSVGLNIPVDIKDKIEVFYCVAFVLHLLLIVDYILHQ